MPEKPATIVWGDACDKSLWPTGGYKVLLTDPPYGLNNSWKKQWHGNNGRSTLRDGVVPEWDLQPVSQSLINSLIDWADVSVIWGGNFYNLPSSPCWFVWDKLQSNRGSDAELAWTNATIKGVKVFRMSRIDAYFNKRRFPKCHVAEKPIQLMAWCIQQLNLPNNSIIFDPFAGVGTTLIAASEAGFSSVGIDINQTWALQAVQRIEQRCTQEADR